MGSEVKKVLCVCVCSALGGGHPPPLAPPVLTTALSGHPSQFCHIPGWLGPGIATSSTSDSLPRPCCLSSCTAPLWLIPQRWAGPNNWGFKIKLFSGAVAVICCAPFSSLGMLISASYLSLSIMCCIQLYVPHVLHFYAWQWSRFAFIRITHKHMSIAHGNLQIILVGIYSLYIVLSFIKTFSCKFLEFDHIPSTLPFSFLFLSPVSSFLFFRDFFIYCMSMCLCGCVCVRSTNKRTLNLSSYVCLA